MRFLRVPTARDCYRSALITRDTHACSHAGILESASRTGGERDARLPGKQQSPVMAIRLTLFVCLRPTAVSNVIEPRADEKYFTSICARTRATSRCNNSGALIN